MTQSGIRDALRRSWQWDVLAALMLLLAGCSAATQPVNTVPRAHQATPSPQPTQGLAHTIAADTTFLLRMSYTPDRHFLSHVGGGQLLIVFHSVCTGSADGHCQAVDVFRGRERRPIWRREFVNVLSLRPTTDGFAVRFSAYAPADPLCCPSRPPVTAVYRWTGSTLRVTTAMRKPAPR